MDKQNYHPYDQKFYTFAGLCPFEKLFQARIEHSTVTILTNQRELVHLDHREPTQRLYWVYFLSSIFDFKSYKFQPFLGRHMAGIDEYKDISYPLRDLHLR